MAANELLRARRKFVDGVNSIVLTQILDRLLEDKVLNDEEYDSILEVKSSTADKARRLIDVVRKKGDKASGKMIGYVQIQDGNFHAELFTQSTQTDQAPQAPQVPRVSQVSLCAQGVRTAPTPLSGYSDTLIPTTEEFWRNQQMDEDVYPVSKPAIRQRVALLITNIEFREKAFNRRGADKDEENMEKLLSALGYEVVKHTNLTAKKIDEALINFSKHPKLSFTDSVIVVIMSSGRLGHVFGVNYGADICANEKQDEFPIDNICKHLTVPELQDKPKIIIIQACRGDGQGSLPSSQAVDEKDFIFLFACAPNGISYRHVVHGSLLIQYVVDVFNTFAHADHIEELFRKVSKRFESFQSGYKKQMATRDRCSLTRRFYFFPGI